MNWNGKSYRVFAFMKCFPEQVEYLLLLTANIFITLNYIKWEQCRKYPKCSQTYLTTITGPHSCHILHLCQNPTNSISNRVLDMVTYTVMPLLNFSTLPKAISQLWCLCFFSSCTSLAPGFHSEGCGSPGMSVSGGPALIAKAPRL